MNKGIIYGFGEKHGLELSSLYLGLMLLPEPRGRLMHKMARIAAKSSLLRKMIGKKGIRRIFAELGEDEREEDFIKKHSLGTYELDVLRLEEEYPNHKHLNSFANWRVEASQLLAQTRLPPGGRLQSLQLLKKKKKLLDELPKLMEKTREVEVKREKNWIKRIDENYIDPSLIFCGRGHLEPMPPHQVPEVGIVWYGTGKVPEMLESLGYKVEILFLET